MSKERLSRIDYLRDKLSQMGHPPANRIVWENELEELLKQPKPTKIKGSIKPRKCNHVAWNRKLLRGYKSNDSNWLPTGYFRSHADYVIPPYLLAAWKSFLAGHPVYGRYWTNTAAPELSGSHWGSKKSKKQVHSNPEVRAEFRQDVDEFFRLMPCMSYQECKERFNEETLTGGNRKEEKNRLRAIKAMADEKALELLERESQKQVRRKLAAELEAQGDVKKIEAYLERMKQIDAYTEKMRAEQWERVEAGRKAFAAAHPEMVVPCI